MCECSSARRMAEADFKSLENAGRALEHIEHTMSPLLSLERKQVTASLTPLENAQLNVALAYAVDSLFYILLRSKVCVESVSLLLRARACMHVVGEDGWAACVREVERRSDHGAAHKGFNFFVVVPPSEESLSPRRWSC